jgi:hypothetical protein
MNIHNGAGFEWSVVTSFGYHYKIKNDITYRTRKNRDSGFFG